VTAPAAWRHVRGVVCIETVADDDGMEGHCLCDDPEPDPASRCGWGLSVTCGFGADKHPSPVPGIDLSHPHLPTRCARCGHAVEPTAWRHVITETVRHVSCSECGCTTPEPDPASPCGYIYVEGDGGERCAWEPQEHFRSGMADHPHQPTRCARCGDAVEPVL